MANYSKQLIKQSHNALISVYIPTKNRSKLLTRAIYSVISQSYKNIEIIVIDDASTDDTPAILQKLSEDHKITTHRCKSSIGAAAARNIALNLATGDLVTGIDDDDVWLPERLERMASMLVPGVGFVAASDIFESGTGRKYLWRRPSHIDKDHVLRRNIVGNQVLARRQDFLKCGGFDEALPASQDYDLWIRLVLATGSGVGIREPLQIIHVQPGRERITTSPHRYRGILKVYRKYRHLMSRGQRKSHIFNAIRTMNKPITIRKAAILWSREDAFRIINHILRGKIPYLDYCVEYFAYLHDKKIISQAFTRHRKV